MPLIFLAEHFLAAPKDILISGARKNERLYGGKRDDILISMGEAITFMEDQVPIPLHLWLIQKGMQDS